MRTTALLAALLLAGAAVLPRNAQAQDAPAPERTGTLAGPGATVTAHAFMIATANPLASQAGPRRAAPPAARPPTRRSPPRWC